VVVSFSVCGATLTRGPYLQTGTPTSVIVRWRTDVATESRVSYGSESGSLLSRVDDANPVTEHIVLVTNLSPDTIYFYAVGSSVETLTGGTNHFFRTAPMVGSQRPFRVWVLGDFGMTNQFAIPVRDAYYGFTGAKYTDLWLMLGDNAYHGGSDAVWQVAVFNTYSNLLRQTVVWSTIGNQETFNSATQPPSVYLQAFSFPPNAEAGGVASGTERYYSFDYGNVHFICLDSMSSARTNGSPMLTWLDADLAASTNYWIVAFWHHPPYSKGSNDSDVRTEEIEMRTNAVPLLENYGVDLVLSGHSHSYERSYLLDGHYGFSSSFTTNFLKNGGDGRVGGNGAYAKNSSGPAGHQGAVYAVTGSGCSLGGGPLNHPAMYRSLNNLGSMVLDFHANRLEAKFIRETGAIDDSFTLIKGGSPPRLDSVTVAPNGSWSVSWSAVADRTYRVEFTAQLSPASWRDISGPIVAGGISASWSGPNGLVSGFVRIVSLED